MAWAGSFCVRWWRIFYFLQSISRRQISGTCPVSKIIPTIWLYCTLYSVQYTICKYSIVDFQQFSPDYRGNRRVFVFVFGLYLFFLCWANNFVYCFFLQISWMLNFSNVNFLHIIGGRRIFFWKSPCALSCMFSIYYFEERKNFC